MNKPCECCERVFPETLLYSVSKRLYCRSCWRKKMRSLDLKWAFWTLAVVAMLFFWLGRASAEEKGYTITKQIDCSTLSVGGSTDVTKHFRCQSESDICCNPMYTTDKKMVKLFCLPNNLDMDSQICAGEISTDYVDNK